MQGGSFYRHERPMSSLPLGVGDSLQSWQSSSTEGVNPQLHTVQHYQLLNEKFDGLIGLVKQQAEEGAALKSEVASLREEVVRMKEEQRPAGASMKTSIKLPTNLSVSY